MPLITDDVQRILHDTILQANLAPTEEIATSIATNLANAITPQLNGLLGAQTGLIPTTSTSAPVMSITEALGVRDVVEAVIARVVRDSTASSDAAEELLGEGFVDVPAILASVRNPVQSIPVVPKVLTGSHAAVSVADASVSP